MRRRHWMLAAYVLVGLALTGLRECGRTGAGYYGGDTGEDTDARPAPYAPAPAVNPRWAAASASAPSGGRCRETPPGAPVPCADCHGDAELVR